MVEDEYGTRWAVGTHDPAKPAVTKLGGLGFTYIVLPRQTFTFGGLDTLATSEDFLRDVRLKDCVTTLFAGAS